MEATGCATAGAIYTCGTAQNPRERPQVLPAYGLQDLRNNHQDPKTKSHPNTMRLPITLGENHGSGHFYLAKNRTFLLCVDTNLPCASPRKSPGYRRPSCLTGQLKFLGPDFSGWMTGKPQVIRWSLGISGAKRALGKRRRSPSRVTSTRGVEEPTSSSGKDNDSLARRR